MMLLYLVRHARSVSGGPFGDMDRPLTAKGEADAYSLAQGLRRAAALPRSVVASPALRCRRTAEILLESLRLPDSSLRFEGSLLAEKADAILAPWRANQVHENCLLVGHQPGLEALACVLLSEEESRNVYWSPGGCACLELEAFPPPDGNAARLRWLRQVDDWKNGVAEAD